MNLSQSFFADHLQICYVNTRHIYDEKLVKDFCNSMGVTRISVQMLILFSCTPIWKTFIKTYNVIGTH